MSVHSQQPKVLALFEKLLFVTFQAQQIHELAVQIGEKVAKAESLGKSCKLHVHVGYMDHLLRNFRPSYPGFCILEAVKKLKAGKARDGSVMLTCKIGHKAGHCQITQRESSLWKPSSARSI